MISHFLLQSLMLIFPWKIRRILLKFIYGYEIHKSAKIGFSIILCKNLKMGPESYIGSLSLLKGLDELRLGEGSRIGNLNWITGQPKHEKHFSHVVDRRSALIIARHSAITHRHLIDCTGTVKIGEFTTIAGWRSQILTHSIDLRECRQDCENVEIGDYCFLGTGIVILKGSTLPSYSVLAAGSVLNKPQNATYALYSGVPAAKVADLKSDYGYFNRSTGYIY